MRVKIAGGLLGLVMFGFVLAKFGFTQIHQEKDLYIVVGTAEVVSTLADGKETASTETMVGITAAADPTVAMKRLNDQLHQRFTPANGYTNHQVVAVHKVRVEILEEVLASKQKPRSQLQFQRYL